MKRRTVIKQIGSAGLLAALPQTISAFLQSCNQPELKNRADFFTDEEFLIIESLCDIIFPATETPAASEVQTAFFVELAVRDCLVKADQIDIINGLKSFQGKGEKIFTSSDSQKKIKAVAQLEKSAYDSDDGSAGWYRHVKKLACIGYFTSQKVSTSVFDYSMDPGDYKGCIDFAKGDKAMAKTYLLYY